MIEPSRKSELLAEVEQSGFENLAEYLRIAMRVAPPSKIKHLLEGSGHAA
jgi:hypothetical protein